MTRSWRQDDFPEAWLLCAVSSITEFIARCIQAEQSCNVRPRVAAIPDSQFLGKNIDIVTVEN